MKIIGMIPARLGSTRVKNKNLRMINDRPLIQYIIDAAKQSNYLDELYLNSESTVFKALADKSEINFYQRPDILSSDQATNDDFTYDFMLNVKGDILVQLLPTSPFLSREEIDSFIDTMIQKSYETLISVKNIQIESVFKNQPINFEVLKQTPPSQSLEPVKAYACGIMGWQYKRFIKNIKKFGAAYHGGNGSIGYFEIKGDSTIDIDNEEDFLLAESVAASKVSKKPEPRYYTSEKSIVADANRERILSQDGVRKNIMNDYNREVTHIEDIIRANDSKSSWSHTVINSKSNCATLIAQMPGEGNRRHHHPNWDEWWYIIKGEWEWEIENKKKIIKEGEVVFIERNRKHRITAYGKNQAIRLAVSRADVDHVYERTDF